MQEFARAKVNLFLHVTGRRTDGYHLLDSLAVFPDAGDHLTAEPAPELTLRIDGPFGAGLDAGTDNLVLRAARALRAETGTRDGAALTLSKHLPVASGIGGGSADAAAALRLLCRLWALDPAPGVLERLAAGLGADVPVCLPSRPARMRGIGERLSPAPALPAVGMVLVNPKQAVSTPAVFRARAPGFTPEAVLPESWPDARSMADDLRHLVNDLEPPARALCPAITAVLDWLSAAPGALLARMSGSGATCYALFPSAAEAAGAAGSVPDGWWAWGGGLPSAPAAP